MYAQGQCYITLLNSVKVTLSYSHFDLSFFFFLKKNTNIIIINITQKFNLFFNYILGK